MNYICINCVGDDFLKKLMERQSMSQHVCEFCCSNYPAVNIEFIAEKCEKVISELYEPTSNTMAVIHFDQIPEGASLRDTIEDLISGPEEAIEKIVEILLHNWIDTDSGEEIYGDDPWFQLHSRNDALHQWKQIENSLRNEGRFLNPKVNQFMNDMFGGINDDITENGSSVLVSAGPGSRYESLYRARVFQSEESMSKALCHPEKYLSTPEARYAKGGRMNAVGQPAFYGSVKEGAAIGEVRPPVGSWVITALFSIEKPIKLLDLKLLSKIDLPSISKFNPDFKLLLRRRNFLRVLCDEMVFPVMPEQQDHSYLVPQVVASYLATHPTASVDGIIYPSVQQGNDHESLEGENIVLFYKSATTKNSESTEPTGRVFLWDYEDHEGQPYFRPTIEFTDIDVKTKNSNSLLYCDSSQQKPTLSLKKKCIKIHKIKSVNISTDEFLVGTNKLS